MEEIITLDGRQFKLTVDRPLNATERAQVLTEIRKQTGCGTCNQPRTLSTGGVYSLPFGNDGAGTYSGTGSKGSGSTMTLKATPNGGVGPYDVRFWRSNDGATIINDGIVTPAYMASAEGTTVSTTYQIVDADVAAATGNTAATSPTTVAVDTGVITLGGAAATLSTGSIRFYTSVVDSCKGSAGQGTCAQYVDVALACIAPTCSFVVT
jgi:hypothetical protein